MYTQVTEAAPLPTRLPGMRGSATVHGGAGGRASEGRIVEASQDPRELPRLSPERLMDHLRHHGRIVSG
jgi:hypothetical protein